MNGLLIPDTIIPYRVKEVALLCGEALKLKLA